MSREGKKKSKYNYKKTSRQILIEYLRTFLCALLIAIVITLFMANHARNEMIKNLHRAATAQSLIDKNLAKSLIGQADLLDNLEYKKYGLCVRVGDLYLAAGESAKAQRAYEIAIEKAKPKVYKPYLKLITALLNQEKFSKVHDLLDNIKDYNSIPLIKFKTRAYIDLGDKYYSVSKFLSAGKAYEKADFYYQKFSRKDKKITESISSRIVSAYIKAADIMVKNSMNSEAIRYLRKAEKYAPENFELRYKIALVLSDSDPEEAAKYLETLLTKIPQYIDYSLWGRTLIKAANIADLDGRPTKSKYYRYKIHSIDLFMNRKVVYKDDFDVKLLTINTSKVLFTYPIKAEFQVINNSSIDIINLSGDFILNYKGEPVETVSMKIADRDKPIFTNGGVSSPVLVKFKRNIFTQKELGHYTIDVYLYKDEKYKTQIIRLKVPRAKNLAQKLLEDFK